jgi:hypothetical protein
MLAILFSEKSNNDILPVVVVYFKVIGLYSYRKKEPYAIRTYDEFPESDIS